MFTAAYPYDRINAWKGQELSIFRDRFEEIYVAPLHQNVAEPSPDLPSGVRALPPAFPFGIQRATAKRRLFSLVGSRLRTHVGLMEPVSDVSAMRRYWAASADVEEIMRGSAWRDYVSPLLSDSILYFFWGRGYAQLLPYLPTSVQSRSLVRFHRWDLYPDINKGYIPYQRRIMECAGVIAPISRSGADLLAGLYPIQADRIRCLPLGTVPNGSSRPSTDGRFQIVSCAYARPVKRLHLIAEALCHIRFPVTWTHIGDGPELARVRAVCAGLPAAAEVRLLGNISPEKVPRIYADSAFDLFLNVSESEGIPVSIMEAMAAGIPVVATAVGGNAELVDDSVGRVVPAAIGPTALAQAIVDMRALPVEWSLAMRAACRQRIERDYDQSKNARAVADALMALW